MSQKRDFYEVLGVGKNASDQEIKSAYRKLALQFHPDRNPNNKEESEEKFKEITEAYGVLADVEKRAAYDRFGHAGLSGMGGYSPDFSSSIFTDFEDIFGDFFGDFFGGGRGQGRRSRAERGADLRYDLEISFEEAAKGLETKIKIPRWDSCSSCGGRGGDRAQCPTCNGRGQLRQQQGFFTISRTCPHCQGLGQVVKVPCVACRGQGRVRSEKVLGIKIPSGVDEGTRLRLGGEGEAGFNGGPPGDLYVVLKVREHEVFERRGNDIYVTVPVSMAQAALGAEIKVPTLNGHEKLRVPEGTQPGSVFRLRGCGIPSVDGRSEGDLYVIIQVAIPRNISREQRRLLESLASSVRIENKPLPRQYTQKVKDTFG